jgi:peptidoglycan/xylan/chitin deacetylase (PgdA/CDA1 family)
MTLAVAAGESSGLGRALAELVHPATSRREVEPAMPRRWLAPPGLVLILTFHGVGPIRRELDEGEDAVWLATDSFERVLDAVAPRRDVLLTFDDANASDAEIVLPALLRKRRRARFFLPAARIGARGFLDRAGVRTLARAGMTIGSHGMHHCDWTRAGPEELREEVYGAKARLEAIVGARVDEAACPFGAYDQRSLRSLRDAGFRRVYTSDRGTARMASWLRPRLTVRRGDDPADVAARVAACRSALGSLLGSARMAWKRWR